MSLLISLMGWVSAGSLLLGYALISSHRVTGDSVAFQLLNSTGALGLALYTAYQGAWPSAALNLAWIGIGAAALARRGSRSPSLDADRAAFPAQNPSNV